MKRANCFMLIECKKYTGISIFYLYRVESFNDRLRWERYYRRTGNSESIHEPVLSTLSLL